MPTRAAAGQYGHVVIGLEPTGPGGDYEFVDKIAAWLANIGSPADRPGGGDGSSEEAG